MPADAQTDGMKVVRYMDLYAWTKDPDQIELVKRVHVTDPKPADCTRLRVEITIPKKCFAAPDVDGTIKAKVVESEPHDGVGRPAEGDPEPLAVP